MPKIVTFGLIEWTWDSFPMSNCAKIARTNFYKKIEILTILVNLAIYYIGEI